MFLVNAEQTHNLLIENVSRSSLQNRDCFQNQTTLTGRGWCDRERQTRRGGRGRERVTKRERHRERQTGSQRDRQRRKGGAGEERESDKERQRERQTGSQRDRQTDSVEKEEQGAKPDADKTLACCLMNGQVHSLGDRHRHKKTDKCFGRWFGK